MVLSRFVVTARVTLTPAAAAALAAGEPGTGSAAGYGTTGISAGYAAFPQTLIAGTPIILDSASPLMRA